jgi:hypothetical protein
LIANLPSSCNGARTDVPSRRLFYRFAALEWSLSLPKRARPVSCLANVSTSCDAGGMGWISSVVAFG